MFSWTFDPETNGILLTPDRQTKRNSEVSPVWHEELRAFLGDRVSIPESEAPIGWYYRGTKKLIFCLFSVDKVLKDC